MEHVSLNMAIQNLARQEGMNLIFDPVLSGSSRGSDGEFYKQPYINARWENITPREAIGRLVKEHKLVLIDNPATTVARITFADRGAKPVDAAQVIGNTNKIVPVMILDYVPLGEALSQLAREAGLDVELNSVVSPAGMDPRKQWPPLTVSFRWEQLSSAQALAAVLDAYDLQMVKDAAGEKFLVSPKAKTDIKPATPEKAQKSASEK